MFLAPLNSMACNIGGATVHSWGRIAFKNKRGVRILATDVSEGMSNLGIKCGALRFLFIDEIEATGAAAGLI